MMVNLGYLAILLSFNMSSRRVSLLDIKIHGLVRR
jgi:hypothetical protein